jgi:transketolase
VTVEDHYQEGGMGEAVAYALRNQDVRLSCLAVTKIPRSGLPQQLMQYAAIDADAILRAFDAQ